MPRNRFRDDPRDAPDTILTKGGGSSKLKETSSTKRKTFKLGDKIGKGFVIGFKKDPHGYDLFSSPIIGKKGRLKQQATTGPSVKKVGEKIGRNTIIGFQGGSPLIQPPKSTTDRGAYPFNIAGVNPLGVGQNKVNSNWVTSGNPVPEGAGWRIWTQADEDAGLEMRAKMQDKGFGIQRPAIPSGVGPIRPPRHSSFQNLIGDTGKRRRKPKKRGRASTILSGTSGAEDFPVMRGQLFAR